MKKIRRRNGRRKRRILLPFSLALVLAGAGCAWNSGGLEERYGLFYWGTDELGTSEQEEMKDILSRAGVREIYQEFSSRQLAAEETKDYLAFLEKQDVDVYALAGEASWALEEDGHSLVQYIGEAAQANETWGDGRRIKGIMADVEPYLLDAWEEGEEAREELMRTFLTGMEAAYKTAEEHGLELLVCIPTFYDATCEEILDRLVRDGCDGIAVMNYNRENEIKQMEHEVELAEKYGKRVIGIYELQEPGSHDLTDINTYRNVGLQVLWASAETMQAHFQYEGLSFAYHYYDPLKEMLQEMPEG